MLSYLRLKAGSWVVKAILAMMAIGLAFFYGYGDFRNSGNDNGSSQQEVAVVNGEAISGLSFERALDNNREAYKSIYGELPDFLEKTIRENTLDQLIHSTLFAQWASREQVPVTKAEIAQKIRSTPELQKDGKFDAEFYKTRFRPGFKRFYGRDYEEAVAHDLLLEKLQWFFEEMAVPSPSADALAKSASKPDKEVRVPLASLLQTAFFKALRDRGEIERHLAQ